MRPDQLPRHKSASFVMPHWQAVYVAVNKAACTSLKWMVADLQGEDPARFHASISREVVRDLTIHRRSLWRHTPTLAALPPEQLAAVDPAAGWFVFSVVRHPAARIWSAWQSKLLLREPWFVERFGDRPWFPRVPTTSDELVEDFRRFLTAVAEHPRQAIMRNRHFAPQGWMLTPERTPYTRIYRTDEIGLLLTDFGSHVRARGYEGELRLPRANETPLRPLASVFAPPMADALRTLYAADYETFGYDDVLPAGLDPAPEYDGDAVAEVARIVERHERINDLGLRAQALSQAARESRPRSAPAPAARPMTPRAVVGRTRRRLRAALFAR